METRLKIAVQKSGRLSESSRNLLKECGIGIKNGKNALLTPATNFPMDILYLRDDDIPQYVEDGTVDIGIVGENVVGETASKVALHERLGFGGCRLSLAIPKGENYSGIQFFEGKRIATSYPTLLSQFLKNQGIRVEIHQISGSVEIAPNIGLADGICDLVSSGSTLLGNGLKEVEVVLRSEAVMISNQNLEPEKQQIFEKLLFRIKAVRKAEHSKYIVLNTPNEKIETISRILPGMKSPTVVPLAQKGWSALHSVLSEDEFWGVIDELKQAGAQGILVVPIEKMIV